MDVGRLKIVQVWAGGSAVEADSRGDDNQSYDVFDYESSFSRQIVLERLCGVVDERSLSLRR